MKQPRMTVRIIGLVALLALVGVACGKSTTSGGKKVADRIVWGTTDSETSNDPAKCYEVFCTNIIQMTYSRLISYGAQGSTLKPDAASKLPDISTDGLTYTFTMKDGLKFSDGSALDANAVKFSLDRVAKLHVSGSAAGLLTAALDSVSAPDAKTVIIKLKRPDATYLAKLSFIVASIVNPKVFSADAVADNKTVAGSGYYKMDPANYLEGQSIQLDANPNSVLGQPKTKTVLIKFYKASSALKLAVEQKEVDVAFHTFLPTETTALKANSALSAAGPSLFRIRFLVFNIKHKPFDNENFRKAIAASIDRNKLNTDAFNGNFKPLYSMIRSAFNEYSPVFKDVYGETPENSKVNSYLTAAGYPAGQKIKIDLWASTNHYGDQEQDAQVVLKRQLEATGRFQVTTKTEDWAAFRPDVSAPPNGKFGLQMLGWLPDYFDPDDYVAPFISAEQSKDQGSFFADPAVEAKIAQEQAATSPSAREPIFADLYKTIADKALYVPLWEETDYIFTQKSVTGAKTDVSVNLRLEELVKSA